MRLSIGVYLVGFAVVGFALAGVPERPASVEVNRAAKADKYNPDDHYQCDTPETQRRVEYILANWDKNKVEQLGMTSEQWRAEWKFLSAHCRPPQLR